MPIYDTRPLGRLVTCRCGFEVDLIEIPAPFLTLDPHVCGCCLKPVTAAARALAGEPEPPAPPARHLRSVA